VHGTLILLLSVGLQVCLQGLTQQVYPISPHRQPAGLLGVLAHLSRHEDGLGQLHLEQVAAGDMGQQLLPLDDCEVDGLR
jgi:hypothetical protein